MGLPWLQATFDMPQSNIKAHSPAVAFAEDARPHVDVTFHLFTSQCLPWLQAMFDMQLSSIKAYSPGGAFAEDTRPHFITQRYAQLTASLLLLNADYQVRPAPTSAPRIAQSCLKGWSVFPACSWLPQLMPLPLLTRVFHAFPQSGQLDNEVKGMQCAGTHSSSVSHDVESTFLSNYGEYTPSRP